MSLVTPPGGVYEDVYVGFWTDWSHGKVRGATITLTRTNGGLLIAFIALFVGAAGKSLWRILCFALHYFLSTPTIPQDGLYHQRQAILRNSETALQGAWQLFNSMLVWKRSHAAQRAFRRSIPIAATAIVVASAFAIAGIFSSRISAGDTNEVLLSGGRCGYFEAGEDLISYWNTYLPWDTQMTQEHATYARSCYDNSSNSDVCNKYVKPRLRFTSDQNASCPFSGSICYSEFGNLKLDTGYIDSHDDLGINAPPEDRFVVRNMYHCAPLKTDGYSNVAEWIDPNRNDSLVSLYRLYYGAMAGWSHYKSNYTNYTYQFPINNTSVYLDTGGDVTGPRYDYALSYTTAWANLGFALNVSYAPIPELAKPDADVTLFFLSAPDIGFLGKVEDPWYSAHVRATPLRSSEDDDALTMTYTKDEPASAVACTSQIQFCIRSNLNATSQDPADQYCKQPNGWKIPSPQWGDSPTNDGKNDRLTTWVNFMNNQASDVQTVVEALEASVLVARSGLYSGFQGTLPDNQWQIEMENLVSASLASIQGHMVSAVRGVPDAEHEKFWSQPDKNDTAAWNLCNNQKIRSSRFPSFSVLGISLILTLGSLMIFLDLYLEPISGKIKDWKWKPFHCKKKGESIDIESPLPTAAASPTTLTTRNDTDATVINHSPTADKPDSAASAAKHLKHVEWNVTSTLQLQRLAHEGVGAGTWKRTESETPITLPGQQLAILEFKEPPKTHSLLVNVAVDGVADGETKSDLRKSNSASTANSEAGNAHQMADSTMKRDDKSSDAISDGQVPVSDRSSSVLEAGTDKNVRQTPSEDHQDGKPC